MAASNIGESGREGAESTGENMCYLPMGKIVGLCEKLKTQEHRLRGLDNLNSLLREKDETILDLRDKLDNCKSALSRTEGQLSVLMRTGSKSELVSLGGSPVRKSLGSSEASRNISYPPPTASSSLIQEQESDKIETAESQTDKKVSDLEEDGEYTCHDTSNKFMASAQPSVDRKGSPMFVSKSGIDASISSVVTEMVVTLSSGKKSTYQVGLKRDTDQIKRDALQATTQFNSGPQSFPSMNEVSHDLVGKLMSQNGRLKKVMRDMLQHKGLTLNDYLVC